MHRASLIAALSAAGCYSEVSELDETLRVEPPAIDLAVELGATPPTAAMRVLHVRGDGREDDVTAAASFAFDGRALGSLADATLTSDGLTGGAATVRIVVGTLTTTLAATAHVHGRRVVDGTPAGAADAFAAASPMPFAAHVDPQDGAVVPADLGRMVVAFAAPDLDDVEQLRVTNPYLDLAIVAPATAGPRTLELSPREWAAIAQTARGDAVELEVASLESAAPATKRATATRLELADLAPSAVLAGGIAGVTGQVTDANLPGLWRYDMRAGAAAPLFANPDGACIGCHLAVSTDGARIAALIVTPTARQLNGVVLNAHAGTVLAMSDPASATPWATAAFDPGGALVTAWQGTLAVRDDAAIAPIVMTDAAAAPAISPDGTQLAYVSLDAGPGTAASQPAGNALRVRAFSAAQHKVGPALELARDAGGVVLPGFSSDGRWIAFGHTEVLPDRVAEVPLRSSAIRTDGSGTTVELTSDPLDKLAHFASPVAAARAGGRPAEPMIWVAIVSKRPVGGNATSLQQLWLAAFYPERGVVAPAFHLPGQPATLQILHGPIALP